SLLHRSVNHCYHVPICLTGHRRLAKLHATFAPSRRIGVRSNRLILRRRNLTANAATRAQDTFPKLACANAERIPDRVAIREKDYGIWQSTTWRDYLTQARAIALGLASLGFVRGDKVAIVGDNRPQLYWAVLAAQALGGVPVPLYQDAIEKELQYIVDHAEVRFAIVEDQEQVDKLLALRASCPRLETIVYDDTRGLRGYSETCLLSLAELQE